MVAPKLTPRVSRRIIVHNAFTLIELIVVIGIIAILVGLVLPAVQAARATARRLQCQNKVRQVTLALHSHTDIFSALPAGTELQDEAKYLAWCGRILPFLEQQNTYSEFQSSLQLSRDLFSVADHPLFQAVNPAFSCPEDSRTLQPAIAEDSGKLVGLLSYLGCNGTNHDQRDGVLFGGSDVSWRAISDGLSNTLLVGERPPSPGNDYGWWYAGVGNGDGTLDHTLGMRENTFSRFATAACEPNNFRRGEIMDECSTSHFWSLHTGGANFGLCDGSVRFFSFTQNDDILVSLATRDRGEVASFGQ